MNTSDVKLKIVTRHVQNPFTRKWGWRSYIYKCESSELENCAIEALIASFVDCETQADAILCAEDFIESRDESPLGADWCGSLCVDGGCQAQQIKDDANASVEMLAELRLEVAQDWASKNDITDQNEIDRYIEKIKDEGYTFLKGILSGKNRISL